jgi:hypothetical protein
MIKKIFRLVKNATSYNMMLLLNARSKDMGFFDPFIQSNYPYGAYGSNSNDEVNTPIGLENLL